MNTDYNIHGAFPLLFLLPLLTPPCLPFHPLLLTWNPPSCDRIRSPRSQVACKLTSPVPTLYSNPPFPNSQNPNCPRLTKTTSGTIRRLLSGTLQKHLLKPFELLTGQQKMTFWCTVHFNKLTLKIRPCCHCFTVDSNHQKENSLI